MAGLFDAAEPRTPSIWVRQLATGTTVQVVAPAPEDITGITFSLDGNYLYFVKHDPGSGLGTLYRIPSLGGTAQQIIVDVDSPISFSPDGKRFAFIRHNFKKQKIQFDAGYSDGSGEQSLSEMSSPGLFSDEGPAWSPDGKRIAVASTPDGDFSKWRWHAWRSIRGLHRAWVPGIGYPLVN